MLRLWGTAVGLLVAIPLGLYAWDFLEQDACLDRGGAWFGRLGCQTDLPQINYIVINKSQRKLMAFANGEVAAIMTVSLGQQPVGQKYREGDSRTPEGIYRITEHKRDSAYHRALRISYPTAQQMKQAQTKGINPGGDIMIHGLPNGMGALGRIHNWADWTKGCIAITDGEIDWLFQSTTKETVVEILP
jgi:murein L,D-transpeptidase YafK